MPQPLQETPQAVQLEVGPESAFRIWPLYDAQLFKSTAAVRGVRSQLFSKEGIFQECLLLASQIKAGEQSDTSGYC